MDCCFIFILVTLLKINKTWFLPPMHAINVVKHIFPFMPPIDVHLVQNISSCKLTMYTFLSPSYIQSMNKVSINLQYLIDACYAI
jgi:hypothetical protein